MKCRIINGIGKTLAVLCMTFCMLLLSFSTATTVNAQSAAKLTTSSVTAERGNTVAVTFALEENPGIWGLKYKVGYDHSALTLKSVTKGSIFEEGDVVLPDSLDREQFVFAAASKQLTDIKTNGTVVTLNFAVTNEAAAKAYPITLEVTQAINLAGEDVNIAAANGSVTVTNGTQGNPNTGDNNNPVVWIALMLLILAGGGIYSVWHCRQKL